MRYIQAFDPSISLLVASCTPLFAYIIYLLHVISIHLTVELLIIHGQQVVKTDHVSKTIHLLLLWSSSLLIEWSIFQSLRGLTYSRIVIGIVHCARSWHDGANLG